MKYPGILYPSIILLFIFLYPLRGNSQFISDQQAKEAADSLIASMKEGFLIVPLMTNATRLNTLEEWLSNPDLDPKTKSDIEKTLFKEKKELDVFNKALIRYFSNAFDFCRVLFIKSEELGRFDPTSARFIDPLTLQPDPEIRPGTKPLFFLRYRSTTGPATTPEEVIALYIADDRFSMLPYPFPSSPDRRTRYKMRFRDLLNLSLNTNDRVELLVVKLNEQLNRYWNR
jgi:hypothetical protein